MMADSNQKIQFAALRVEVFTAWKDCDQDDLRVRHGAAQFADNRSYAFGDLAGGVVLAVRVVGAAG